MVILKRDNLVEMEYTIINKIIHISMVNFKKIKNKKQYKMEKDTLRILYVIIFFFFKYLKKNKIKTKLK
jgi:hypothetical protein